jgi:hypothetical protein
MRALAAVLVLAIAIAADAPLRVTGQLLDYEKGFVFFTTGDGFRVAPGARILEFTTGTPADRTPVPRDWARVTFDATGTVTELELSRTALAPEGDFEAVRRFAIALSTPAPNPDLAPVTPGPNGVAQTFSGRPVLVTLRVLVPPTTPLTAIVYITTDQSAWNPQAMRMDRIDALHFQLTRRFNSGTHFRYLYTRGSLDTQERGQNGLQRLPRTEIITDADARTVSDTVYDWADGGTNGQQPQPQSIPTPYNPAPFPNLPPGAPTPHP